MGSRCFQKWQVAVTGSSHGSLTVEWLPATRSPNKTVILIATGLMGVISQLVFEGDTIWDLDNRLKFPTCLVRQTLQQGGLIFLHYC